MNNSQKIDAYFNNELSSAEKEQFLAELENNTDLQKEFTEQKDIVRGIQEYRKAELISRLNDIKIVSSTQYMAIKVMSSVAIATLVGLGAYFIYFNNPTETQLMSEEPQNEIVIDNSSDENQSSSDILAQEPSSNEPVSEADIKEEESEANSNVADSKPSNKASSTQANEPEVTMPQVVESFDTERTTIQTEEDISAPANTIRTDLDLSTKFEVEVQLKRKYDFHYQVIDKKLTLFGEFDDGPFEILEINANNGVDLYLFYQDKFYGIDQASEEIQALSEINDQSLIDRLQKLR